MSRGRGVYDNWEKLVGAVINREELRRIALCESFSSSISISTDFSYTSALEDFPAATALDSGGARREGDPKKVAPFFAGVMKIFKDSQRLRQGNGNVTVNGHLISNRLIKKAEEIAGPILPGHYWYDFRAGFWGVIGGRCLGIIPPFIEQFNYPMVEDCAGGNTRIFVNGRELNQNDLNELSARGLPMKRERYYSIEISGRVVDENTGDVLPSLGKLGPTVMKVKRGFGMRIPKYV